jgi:hypothetical protein
MRPSLYEFRLPKDLSNRRLRTLAAALGPTYVRVSGTWANSTYFASADEELSSPPEGYNGLLTTREWQGVVEFSQIVDAHIATSFAISPGTRDASGAWTPDQAARVLDYTRSLNGRIVAAEFMNEPNLAAMGGAPKGYDAAAYGRDFRIFEAFVRRTAPEVLVIGPSSVGERASSDAHPSDGSTGTLATRDMLRAGGGNLDAFSYHHYGAVSRRCAGFQPTTPEAALSEEWLSSTDGTLGFYRKLRDEFAPGKPLWLTETADAVCEGNPWAATFLDTFRYLDQLGRLAKAGVQVVMHNTLAASDYGLLDEQTYAPRPNYWAALLWRRMMGTAVLESGVPVGPGLHVYAHCLRGRPGGVVLLVINTSRTDVQSLAIPSDGERFTLSAHELQAKVVQLNRRELRLGVSDDLPDLRPDASTAGASLFAPATISFVALPRAKNPGCR